MKFFPCLATAVLLTLTAASCSNEDDSTGKQVSFHFTADGVEKSPMTRTSLAEPGNLLVLDYFGSTVTPYQQQSLAELSLPLEYGEHTLYFVAATNRWTDYDSGARTIWWDAERTSLSTVWAYCLNLTVESGTTVQEIQLPLVVADVVLASYDCFPADMGNLRGEAPDICRGLDLNTMTGFLTDTPYDYTFDCSAYIGKRMTLDIYTFIPHTAEGASANVGDVVVTAYSATDPTKELNTKTVDSVPVTVAYRTRCSAYYFSNGISVPLSYASDWLGTNNYAY